MRRSAYRRAAAPSGGNRRLLAVGAVIAALGAVVAFTTISNAATNDDKPAGSGAGKVVNGQVILTDTCVDSKLLAHDGFQKGDRCVSTEFGEVGSANNNPSLLITSAPRQVTVNTPFTLKVSTRNLIRDRFLAAGKGGYYVESSVLQNGIERGHFHTACRMLTSTRSAPKPDPVPAFFVATEDQKGGRTPDTVIIQVPGLPAAGVAQCASWAGDGSHRIPMMERANQTPAIDVVRIRVRDAANTGGNTGGGNTGGGNTGGNTGGGNTGGNTGTGNTGGNNGGNGNNGGGNTGGTATKPPTKAPTTPPTTTPTTTPTKAGTTTAPTTKSDVTPATRTRTPEPTRTSKAATTTKKSTTTSLKPAPTRTTEGSESDTTESDPEPAETPEATPSSDGPPAATDYTYSSDDGVVNSGEKTTKVDQVASEQSTSAKQGGLLALTGGNSMILIGAAVVLMLVGLAVMALTRRQRPGSPWQ